MVNLDVYMRSNCSNDGLINMGMWGSHVDYRIRQKKNCHEHHSIVTRILSFGTETLCVGITIPKLQTPKVTDTQSYRHPKSGPELLHSNIPTPLRLHEQLKLIGWRKM